VKKRHIIFHVGQPKTASSALQGFLSANVKKLEEKGVSYPFPESAYAISSGTCAGNLMHTMQSIAKTAKRGRSETTLRPNDLFQEHFAAAVELGVREAKTSTVVFSAEALATTIADSILPVLKILNADYKIRLVGFVRDPYDFAVSAWKHLVRSEGLSQGFEDHIASRIEGRNFGVEKILAFLPAVSSVKLINYDFHRSDIFSPFLRKLGLRDELGSFETPLTTRSNPSLTYEQAVTLVQARQAINSQLFIALLIKRFRSQQESRRDPYVHKIDKIILEFLKEDLEKINTLLPDGQKLRTAVRCEQDGERDTSSPEALVTVMEVANEAIELAAKRAYFRPQAGLPADFDPMVYLILNPDLEVAGVEPVHHYVTNGRFEGRKYK
jgi:hypothetical protein